MLDGLLNVEHYKDIKQKIAAWTLIILSLELYYLDIHKITPFSFLDVDNISFDYPIIGSASVSIVIYPVLCSVFSHIFLIHDKISSIIRIRPYFDYKYIYVPIVEKLSVARDERIKQDKLLPDVMGRIFYKYASSTDNSLVRKHDIHEALTNWSWFWVATEVIFYNSIIYILMLTRNQWWTVFVLSTAIIPIVVCIYCWNRSIHLASIEVKQILDCDKAQTEIRDYLNGL